MEDGISETLHIASMGIDYTFRIVSGSSKLLLDFIKYVCNKAVLSQKEKAALQQMMRASANACIQINKADVKNFEKLLNGHGVKYTKFTPVTSTNRKPGYTNFSFDIAQVDLLNVCLREINYAEFVNESKVGDGKNAGPSNRTNREQNTGSGVGQNTEEQDQSFDGYEFTSNYEGDEFHVPGSDRVVQKTSVSEKKTEAPTIDAFSFLSSASEVNEVDVNQESHRDRIPAKNVIVAAKEEYEDLQKDNPAHMSPPDLCMIDGIIARAKDKSDALDKEKREAAMLVKDALNQGVLMGKETLK